MTDNIKTASLEDLKAMKERGEFFPAKPAHGGPAFPDPARADPDFVFGPATDGMSLRDWFAGQALAGLCTNPEYEANASYIVSRAYHIADSMLYEREQA